jgi:branched-chain amino acid transport system ATP-binding protein
MWSDDLHLAFTVCDRIAVVEKGPFVHAASTTAFRHDPNTAHRLLGVT